MKQKLKCVLATVFLMSASVAQATPLDDARAKGTVIEQPDGYVKAVDPSAKAFADDVNAQRKQKYEEIVKKAKADGESGVDLKSVGEKAAKKIQEKLGK